MIKIEQVLFKNKEKLLFFYIQTSFDRVRFVTVRDVE